MSLCPACGRALNCDHTPAERGQTFAEMCRNLTPEEMAAWESGDDDLKLQVARKYAHYRAEPPKRYFPARFRQTETS